MLRSTTDLQSSEESLCIPGKVKPYANVGSTLKKTLGDGGLLRRTKIERGKEESFSPTLKKVGLRFNFLLPSWCYLD